MERHASTSASRREADDQVETSRILFEALGTFSSIGRGDDEGNARVRKRSKLGTRDTSPLSDKRGPRLLLPHSSFLSRFS